MEGESNYGVHRPTLARRKKETRRMQENLLCRPARSLARRVPQFKNSHPSACTACWGPRQIQWGRWANVPDAQSVWSARQEGLEPETRYSGFFSYLGHFAMFVTRVGPSPHRRLRVAPQPARYAEWKLSALLRCGSREAAEIEPTGNGTIPLKPTRLYLSVAGHLHIPLVSREPIPPCGGPGVC